MVGYLGVAKPTEMTIRDLLQEELRRRGVRVVPEFSVLTPDGRRMMPDMLLKDGAPYVVETKLGAETKLLDAMMKLYEYAKFVTEAKGAFAVLFPEELRRWPADMVVDLATSSKTEYVVTAIFKDWRPSQRFAGNLAEIADWMATQVLRPPSVEADTGLAIRVLREASDYLNVIVRQLKVDDLADIYGGKTVFENVLQYEEGRYPLEEMRHAAAYLLINQLLFYYVLSRVDSSLPPLDEEKIQKPIDLAQYFEHVLKRDYSSIFGFDVASRLPVNATDVVKKVVMVVKALAPEKIRHDLLGKVFHELIPFEVRKAVAAFYTNNEAAEILAQLAIDKPDAKVMDLACGSGTLLVAAYRRKRELLQKEKGDFTLEDHKRFLEQDLTGVDIMPFAAHMAVVHLSLQALAAGHEAEKVRIAVWDSTELKPGQTIPAISRELKAAYRRPTLEMFIKERPPGEEAYIEKGAVTLEGIGGEQIQLEQSDLVIMNPPFTRYQRIPTYYKEILAKRFSEYTELLHGQSGYHGYFIFLADRFLKYDGRLALVLPATVLRIKSALGVRELLTRKYHIEHIITTWERSAFSESTSFREILLIARKLKTVDLSSASRKCAVIVIKKLPKSPEEAHTIAEKIKVFSLKGLIGDVFEDSFIICRIFAQSDFIKSKSNLFPLISFQNFKLHDLWDSVVNKGNAVLRSFRDYLTRVNGEAREGIGAIEGGQYQYLFISLTERHAIKKRDVWIVKAIKDDGIIAEHRHLKNEAMVPITSTCYGLRRSTGISKIDVTSDLDFIVIKEFPDLQKFLAIFKGKKRDQFFIRKWEKHVTGMLSNLAFMRRFNISAPGSKLLAFCSSVPMAPLGLMWSVKVPEEDAKFLSLWLNSSINILQTLRSRKETEGAFMQIDKYTLDDMRILDPTTLSKDQKKFLMDLFERVKGVDFPCVLEQLRGRFWARVEIDKAILKVLGFNETETNQLLDYLYPALTKEIEQLKTLMQG